VSHFGASDRELIKEYASSRSEGAFAELVRRHLALVYQAALRQTGGDAHLADDVTQAVFLLLSQKAVKLKESVVVAGWLYNATRHIARSAMKDRARRGHHERESARSERMDQHPTEDSAWREMLPYLDDAMNRLRRRDREVVLLRYFQGRDFDRMSAELGMSDAAVRRRTSRAVERLREYFKRRNLTLSAGAIEAALAAHALNGPPGDLNVSSLLRSPSPYAKSLARGAAARSTTTVPAIAASVVALLLIAASLLLSAGPGGAPPLPEDKNYSLSPGPSGAEGQAIRVRNKSLDGFPIAPGWPLALPGEITGTISVGDLEGNGKLCVIAVCRRRGPEQELVHPEQSWAPLVFAFHADGTTVKGFPVQLTEPVETAHATTHMGGSWSGTPSIVRRDGRDCIVLNSPFNKGLRVIRPDGTMRSFPYGGKTACNVPVADIDGDGVPDVVMAKVLQNIDGGPIKTWPKTRIINTGYAPAIGDAKQDGQPLIYYLSWRTGIRDGRFAGYDRTGQMLPGWPKRVVFELSDTPVLGDVIGDGNMEVFVAMSDLLCAWTWDGKPLPNTRTVEQFTGVFKAGIDACVGSTLSLADLDGDGKAEIILFDNATKTLRAWHGNGDGIGNDDGILATLPIEGPEIEDVISGVSVADLGHDGVWDFFLGTYWVKWDPRTNTNSVTNMLPDYAQTNNTQPTICDLDGDGKADILFGIRDGRVFVYQTGLAYNPHWCQWPTANGNFQHTGVWKSDPQSAIAKAITQPAPVESLVRQERMARLAASASAPTTRPGRQRPRRESERPPGS